MCDNERDGVANFAKEFNDRDGRSSFGIRE